MKELIAEINNSVTAGIGVLLLWHENQLYKFHQHHKCLDGEDALKVLLGSCTVGDRNKLKQNWRPSNRTRGGLIAYASNGI